jgi:hypothetical protein
MELSMLRLFAVLFIIALATAPALAKTKDRPNSGYCKNGKLVANVANCPENRKKHK